MKKRKITILSIIFILFFNICHAESIQEEITKIEKEADNYKFTLENTELQQYKNIISYELYLLWDNELNSLWKRLFKEVNTTEKKKLLIQQKEWINRKKENIKIAGQPYEGGSIQSLVCNIRAMEMTKARVYILAKYLAHIRKESFIISNETKEWIDYEDPSLDNVFELFEGCWEIYEKTGNYICIERSNMSFYGVEGSNWTLWISDGIVLSDLDIYSYTKDSIIFKVSNKDKNIFYQLSVNIDYSMVLVFGNSLEDFDRNNAIFSYDFRENSKKLEKFIEKSNY